VLIFFIYFYTAIRKGLEKFFLYVFGPVEEET
jgi:hypothetical protein